MSSIWRIIPVQSPEGYINIDLFTYVQFLSDSGRYPLRGKDECTLKKNYARTNTFKFSFFNRIVDMWNTLPLPIRQARTIASFKKGVREFLDGNVWGFLIIIIIILSIVCFVHISVCIFAFLIVCLLNLVLWYEYFLEGGLSSMGSLTFLQTVLMAMPVFLSLTWNLCH